MSECGSFPCQTWYCIQTHPQKEERAERELHNQGFSTFSPKVLQLDKALRPVIRPMFRSYLFVAFELADPRWRTIHSTRGCRRLISADAETPLHLPWGFIESLKSILDRRGRLDLRRGNAVMVDDEVEILAGPFINFHGLCAETESKRVAVMLTLFGREDKIWFRRRDVRIVKAHAREEAPAPAR